MKVKVIESFIDKYTNEVHPLDEEFECSDARYNEIINAGHYVEVVAEQKKRTKVSNRKE